MLLGNNPIDGLRSIKHLYQFQISQEVIEKIHILTVFRDFQTTFFQNIEGQQTIYSNNNFLTPLYCKLDCMYPFSVAYTLEAQKMDFSFACMSSSCWKFIENFKVIQLGWKKNHLLVTVRIVLKFYKKHGPTCQPFFS
jgi:hypothetical protein